MLPSDKPPPDPSCLQSFISDERTSDVKQQQIDADLLKPGLDDGNFFPKFSIRDYVSSTRRKDFETNWPFSLKNLQLCLKHGVSNVLPPFQALASLRNQSNNVVDFENNDSNKSAEDKEYPSTASQLTPDINHISVLKGLSLVPEAQSFQKNRDEKVESSVLASNKVKSSIQIPAKKCRLIVKLSKTTVSTLNEASALNNSVMFETMASKVCPVCKTFSSSSNTTLNAHIDQCLSREYTIKWTTTATESKHRIKPRKIRLMDDIYATAQLCTLEDLDKRNGTNWASNLSAQDKDTETYSETKNETCSSVNEGDNEDRNAVYIDPNGTKLCILSKLNDQSTSSILNDNSVRRYLLRQDQGSKHCNTKKYLVPKHKLLKCSHRQKSSSSTINNNFQEGSQGRKFSGEKVSEERIRPLISHDHRKVDFGMIKQWVSTKRTGLKKISLKSENRCQDKIKKLQERSSLSASKNRVMKRSHGLGAPILSDDLLLLTQNNRSKDRLSHDLRCECMEPVSSRNRMGLPLLEPPDCRDKKKQTVSTKCCDNQSRDYCNSDSEHNLDQLNFEDYSVISPRVTNSALLSSGKESPAGHGKTFLSSRKNLLSRGCLNVPESKKHLRGKCVQLKKRRLRYLSESDEEARVLRKKDNSVEKLSESAARMEKFCAKLSLNRTGVSEVYNTKEKVAKTGREVDMASYSEISAQSETHCVAKETDSMMINNVLPIASNDDMKKAEEQTLNIAEGETFMGFQTSLSSALPPLTSSKERMRNCGQKVFYADKADEDMITYITDTLTEMDTDEGSYFVDVDTIAIPGPPGSFLPSPGRLDSEDLPGNSSLTNCRLQSSDEENALVDMDSSDSPVSGRSIHSISDNAICDSASMQMQLNGVQNETGYTNSGARINYMVDLSMPFEIASNEEGNLELSDSGTNLNFCEKCRSRFQNDHPCRYSKEGVSHCVSSNHEESLLLQQWITSSRSDLSPKEKKGNPKEKLNSLCLISETFPMNDSSKLEENFSDGSVVYEHSEVKKFPSCSGFNSPNQSNANPILRLMGKNLMVINKDENASPQAGPAHSCMFKSLRAQSCINNIVSTDKLQNAEYSFRHVSSQGPSLIQSSIMSTRHFESDTSKASEIECDKRPPHLSRVLQSGQNSFGTFSTSLENLEYVVKPNSTNEQFGSKIGLNTPLMYDADQNVRKSPFQLGAVDFPSNNKKIYVINDSKGSEAGSANSFYSYQRWDHNIHQMVTKGVNLNPVVDWNLASVESNTQHLNSVMASSSLVGYWGSQPNLPLGILKPSHFA